MSFLSDIFEIAGVTFYVIDVIALIFFIVAWQSYALYSDHPKAHQHSLLNTMNELRREWIRRMVQRENRIVDATIIGNLLRSISFFASTSIFILLGLVTMLGYGEKALNIIHAIPFTWQGTQLMWEIKILLLAVIFIFSFFKFTWSLRQYNYACVYVAAMPPHNEELERHEDLIARGGRLISNAAWHFNIGMRAYYFGLAATGWFLHPLLFIATTLLVVYVVYRREHRSHTLSHLSGEA